MSNFEQQQEEQYRRQHAEGREANYEAKETQDEELEKKMAARERVEKVAQEVKSTKQRMQNIMVNIQQVIAAVRAIRTQLGLDQENEVPVIKKDKKTLEELKNKLTNLLGQVADLKLALENEEVARLRQINPNMSEKQLETEAKKGVAKILNDLGVGEKI